MKRILVVFYSQSGQLRNIVDATIAPLLASPDIEVTRAEIRATEKFPFPWPVWRFFNTFPESVYQQPTAIEALSIADDAEFDLIILAYQVWFLSPSLPISTFLQSPLAARLLRDKPVITLIGCRNMWLTAQEKVKQQLARIGATLIDNVVLTDSSHSALTFISTPLWVLSGNRGPFLRGLIPAAGVDAADIKQCARFGAAIAAQLPARQADDHSPFFSGLGAVKINETLIASELIAHRSFLMWGALLRAAGNRSRYLRNAVLAFYIVFLVTLILTIVPISAVLKRLIAPFTKTRVRNQRAYYAAPSGEDDQLRNSLT